MKTLVLLVALVLGMVGNASGVGIHAAVNEIDGKTVISCMPFGNKGDIIKARIFLYVSNGINFETGIQAMDVSYANVASYELPDTYEIIEGNCKLIMLEEDEKVSRQEFIVSMR